MPIRERILVLLLVVAAFIASSIAITWVGLRTTEGVVQRIAETQRRFQALNDVEQSVSNHAEQIAEVLLLGEEQMDDFLRASLAVDESLRKLGDLASESAGAEGRFDTALVQRLGEVHRAIALAAEHIFRLREEGRQAEAVAAFRSDVEYQLSYEFKTLLASATSEARGELAAELAEARERQARLVAIAILLSILTSLSCAALGRLLYRDIVHPVRRLRQGADAIAQGDLDHRVGIAGRGDFSRLAASFDAMAKTLKEKQEGLAAAQLGLEREVRARTRELTLANERLQRIDGQRAQFFADVSHELRTPLTILRGEADVALRAGDGESHRDSLSRIRAQAAEMGRLLEELLAFARSESEDVPLDLEPVELARVLGEAIADSQVLAERAGVSVESRVEDPSMILQADAARLRQVFLIGLDNAIKYSARGDLVTVSAIRIAGEAQIVISDSGIGLPDGEGEQAFERFYRGPAARGRSPGGLGLGLSIARTIVERHRGEIALEGREEGAGARLRIRLPLVPR
ncbi:sensor histidine kinase [Aureimonas populi]|uniref:histidine kinase n=1 Tax=Aureimonas populi TaxID=1701758 RepID=A0ABW5CJ36_9HYPH|nr:ATP-binding protein [Aureimonas populi]